MTLPLLIYTSTQGALIHTELGTYMCVPTLLEPELMHTLLLLKQEPGPSSAACPLVKIKKTGHLVSLPPCIFATDVVNKYNRVD